MGWLAGDGGVRQGFNLKISSRSTDDDFLQFTHILMFFYGPKLTSFHFLKASLAFRFKRRKKKHKIISRAKKSVLNEHFKCA